MKHPIKFILLVGLLLQFASVGAQDVMMQGWYWEYPKTANGHQWADTLYLKAHDLAEAGITHMWLPPLSRTSSGSFSNGYDPKDLFDLGGHGQGPTSFGTDVQLASVVDTFAALGVDIVADVVYNHRDGGVPEANPAVEGWIENYDCTKVNAGDQPFPSDRYQYVLPIGGSTGLADGTYYIKVESRSGHPNFDGYGYSFVATTNTQGWAGQPDLQEDDANNNGLGCGSGSDAINLGYRMVATLDNSGGCGAPCRLDEFALTVQPSELNTAGDSIYIVLRNDGGYSDHYISEVWYNGSEVSGNLVVQTYTDFTTMPSGRGDMNYLAFKPNGSPTNLGGDWDGMFFYYDYDQNYGPGRDTLFAWTKWLYESVGVKGLRLDAVKHFDPVFVGDLLDYLHDQGVDLSMAVGEFYDSSPALLNGWVDAVYNAMDMDTRAAITPQIFDFTLRDGLKNACDQFGYDVRNLYTSNLVAQGSGGDRVVTFCNNHDFRDHGQPIWNDPDLAYAFMFLHGNLGTPCVFYPDYYGVDIPHTQGLYLKNDIDLLIDARSQYIVNNWNHINLNQGFYSQFYAQGGASSTILMQVKGGGGNGQQDAIAVINFGGDTLDVYTTIEGTNVSPGNTFADVTGKALQHQSTVNASYEIRAVVPPRSFALYVKEPTATCSFESTIYVDASATGQGNGRSWADAMTYLPAAVEAAALCPQIDTIKIAQGSYPVDFEVDETATLALPNGLVVLGGYPQGGGNDASRDPSLYVVDVTGVGTDARRIIYHGAGPDTTVVSGLQITGGAAFGSVMIDQQAAGLVNQGPLRLVDVSWLNMQSLVAPEVILNSGSNAYLELTGVTISGNDISKADVLNQDQAILKVLSTTPSVLQKP